MSAGSVWLRRARLSPAFALGAVALGLSGATVVLEFRGKFW